MTNFAVRQKIANYAIEKKYTSWKIEEKNNSEERWHLNWAYKQWVDSSVSKEETFLTATMTVRGLKKSLSVRHQKYFFKYILDIWLN